MTPSDAHPAKASARVLARAALAGLGEVQRRRASEAIITHLDAWLAGLPGRPARGPVMAFWPMTHEEPDIRPLLASLAADRSGLALPRVEWATGAMTPALVRRVDAELEQARPGLMSPRPSCDPVAPATLAAVLVPGLAFDPSGGRLGRGKGFYDRFLAALPPGTPTIGVAFECQLMASVPATLDDQRVAWIVTEAGTRPARPPASMGPPPGAP